MSLKKCVSLLVSCLGFFPVLDACPYLEQREPGSEVCLFAPGILSIQGRMQQSVTFSEDGREYFIGITSASNWNYESILRTQDLGDGKTVTETPSFVKAFLASGGTFIGEPFLAPDGSQLFFVANYPPDIFVATRQSHEWGEAKALPSPVNSEAAEWSPCVVPDGTLYFCSARNRNADDNRIYKSEKVDGIYREPELLQGAINEDSVGDPVVSPDESYIVYASPKEGGCGGLDLYISFRQTDGTWSKGTNLGSKVNTVYEELGPRISHDGKYLFFYRREKWKDASFSDIYWTEMQPFLTNQTGRQMRP